MRKTSGSPINDKQPKVLQVQLCGQRGTRVGGEPELRAIEAATNGSMKMNLGTIAVAAAAPSGAAGGDLGGTYPNPTVVSGANLGAATVPNSALQATVMLEGDAASGDLGGTYPSPTVTSGAHLGAATVPNSALQSSVALHTDKLSAFAATSSSELAGVLSDETGTGKVVFSNSPALVTPDLGVPSAIDLTNATNTPGPTIGSPGTSIINMTVLDAAGQAVFTAGTDFPNPTGAWGLMLLSNHDALGLMSWVGSGGVGAPISSGDTVTVSSSIGAADSGKYFSWMVAYR